MLDTAAIQGAIDACHRAGGGTVRFPPGTYLTKPIDKNQLAFYLKRFGLVQADQVAQG